MTFRTYDSFLAYLDAMREENRTRCECEYCEGLGRTGDGEDAEKWKCLNCNGTGREPDTDDEC